MAKYPYFTPFIVALYISLFFSCTSETSQLPSDESSSSILLFSSSSSSLVLSSSSVLLFSSSSSSLVLSSSSVIESSSSEAVLSSSSIQAEIILGTPVIYEDETYNTVIIGSQTWMARNLNYNASGSKCYNNDEAKCAIYGRLYDWATAMALSASCNSSTCASQIGTKHQGICPVGWHIPSATDWNVLMKYVDPSSSDNSPSEGAGAKLKATSGWEPYYEQSGNGQDTYGFAALPSGVGYSNGHFDYVGTGYWWSSAEESAYSAYLRWMDYHEYVLWGYYSKSNLYSIRCLQD